MRRRYSIGRLRVPWPRHFCTFMGMWGLGSRVAVEEAGNGPANGRPVRPSSRLGGRGARRTRSGPREGGWSGAREWRATEQGGGALLRAGSRWRRAAQERERREKRGEREGGKAARDGAPLYSRGVFRWQKGGHAGSGRLIGRRNSQVLSGLIRLLNPVTAPLIVGWQANIQPWPKRLYIWRPPGAGLLFERAPSSLAAARRFLGPLTLSPNPTSCASDESTKLSCSSGLSR
jgi:hypothetical protein